MKNFLVLLFFAKASLVVAQVPLFEEPTNLGSNINTAADETRPMLMAGGNLLYFSRGSYKQNTGGATGGKDIWFSQRRAENTWTMAINGMSLLNTKKNNEVLGIGRGGLRLYLTNSYGVQDDTFERIVFSDFENGDWTEPLPLGIKIKNNKSVADFYIHPSEEVVLFSMKTPVRGNQEDLYVCLKSDTTDWSAPIHLGATINTSGKEITPFLSKDKKVLYFSSDGHPGFGDMDIFLVERQDETWQSWSKPVNLGNRVNSEGFDAHFIVSENQEMFFSSDRDGGLRDLYYSRLQTQEVIAVETDVFESAPTEEVDSLIVDTMSKLSKVETDLEDIPSTIIVHFGFDAFSVKNPFTKTLDSIANYLDTRPKVDMEIVGHTDSVGPENYNHMLSERRAKAVKQYFVNKGIRGARIVTMGRGELYPYTSNATGEGRRLNRRAEIIFILN